MMICSMLSKIRVYTQQATAIIIITINDAWIGCALKKDFILFIGKQKKVAQLIGIIGNNNDSVIEKTTLYKVNVPLVKNTVKANIKNVGKIIITSFI